MEAFQEKGWNLTPEGFTLISEGLGTNNLQALIKHALDFDLRDIGAPSLPEDINRSKVESLPGGSVLQVSKVRNVAAPKVNEESGAAPRMLKISLTDGTTTCHGVEVQRIDKISLNTPPGTKIRLKAKEVPVINNFLQLENSNIEVLGGKVEALVEKWEITRKLAQFTRAGVSNAGGEGPPKWVQFGKKIDRGAVGHPERKAPAQTPALPKDQAKDSEFDSQRKDAIEEASKQGAQKVFGGGNKEIKEASRYTNRGASTTATNETANTAEKFAPEDEGGRGGRRGGRRGGGGEGRRGGRGGREENADYSQPKPSTGISLFDFLDEKFPGQGGGGSDETADKSAQRQRNNRDDTQRNHPRSDRGDRSGGRGIARSQSGRSDRRNGEQEHRGGKGEGHRRQDEKKFSPFEDRRNDRRQPRDNEQRGGGRGGRDRDRGGRGGDRGGDRDRGDRGDRERGDRGDRGGDRQRGGRNDRGSAPGGRPRQDQKPVGNDSDFGEWSNSTYLASQRGSGGMNALASDMQQLNVNQQQPRRQRDHRNREDYGNREYNNFQERNMGSWGAPPVNNASHNWQQQQQLQQQQQAYSNQTPHSHHQQRPYPVQKWRVGNNCLAKYWEDEQYYPVEVTAVSENTAVVLFKEYGNHEEVLLSDLLPFPPKGGQAPRYIPTTPGLPPAFPQS